MTSRIGNELWRIMSSGLAGQGTPPGRKFPHLENDLQPTLDVSKLILMGRFVRVRGGAVSTATGETLLLTMPTGFALILSHVWARRTDGTINLFDYIFLQLPNESRAFLSTKIEAFTATSERLFTPNQPFIIESGQGIGVNISTSEAGSTFSVDAVGYLVKQLDLS